MASPRIDFLDDKTGAGVERLTTGHHRRRLKRRGWLRALEPPDDGLWCAGDPPPRDGNAVKVLVDGSEALPSLEADIAAAQESVLLAGWAFTPSFHLSANGPPLRELLASTAAEVRVLAWAGAPLPLFHPSRREVRETRDALVRGTRIRMELDDRERPMHCHHEKLAVIDGRIAYVGGIDLTSLGGDRLDSSDHPARGSVGWHDVSTRVEGPLVADVAGHIAQRWLEIAGEHLSVPSPDATGMITAQLVRTVPERVYGFAPDGEFRILEAYVRALRSAQTLVYLESQFLWSPEIVAILLDKLRNPPTPEFRMVVLLPARANNGEDDTRGQLGQLVRADKEERLLACSLYQPGHAGQVYVHAKVAIIDDRWLCIGSANLNDHSLFNDTEVCLITGDPELARDVRLRLWREHLQHDDVGGEPHRVVDDHWKPRAESPEYHRLALLPHVSRRSRALLGPLNGLLVDG
jgi:phosphatidylserine/phosphatidylglycerophosphate/cardiolipin synthase-like enzyme